MATVIDTRTDEEKLRDMSLYMACRICGEPRVARETVSTDDSGHETRTLLLACPNGHPQD